MSEALDGPEILATFRTQAEAALTANHLIAQGIKAHVEGPSVDDGLTNVIVRLADFARAKELLDLVQRHTIENSRLDSP